MDTDQDVEFHSPQSYSESSNDFSLSSLEVQPVISNKYSNKHECRSDSSGCGMSSTRVSKENTQLSGVNIAVDNNKLVFPIDYESEVEILHCSTPKNSIVHNLHSPRTNHILESSKQNNESQKRHSSKKHRKMVTIMIFFHKCTQSFISTKFKEMS